MSVLRHSPASNWFNKTWLGAAASVLMGILCPLSSMAASYPDQPLKIIVPYGPGGTGDVIARLVARELEGEFTQGVIVENKGGAAGTIGASMAARAQPDGYTLLLGYTSEMVINPIVQSRVPYKLDDFDPVAFAGSTPLLLVVNPSVQAHSLDELIALAKAAPNSLSYASAGMGSPAHIAGALLAKLGGVDMLHVPYKGGSQAVMDTVGGVVSMYFSGMPPAIPFVKNGKLRAIGVASKKHSAALPEVPALAAENFPALDLAGWFGFFVPKGVPEGIRTLLNQRLNEALQSAEVKQSLRKQGVETQAMSSEQFAQFVTSEQKKYAQLITQLDIAPAQSK